MEGNRPEIDPGRALFELAPRLTRLGNAVLRAVTPPLTFRQFRLLERVNQGQSTVTELGRNATITLPAISESVDGLVSKGLLNRQANQHDRRELRLSLTSDGESALRQARGLLEASAKRILTAVPESRHADLSHDLQTVKEQVTDALIDSRNTPASERNQLTDPLRSPDGLAGSPQP